MLLILVSHPKTEHYLVFFLYYECICLLSSSERILGFLTEEALSVLFTTVSSKPGRKLVHTGAQ